MKTHITEFFSLDDNKINDLNKNEKKTSTPKFNWKTLKDFTTMIIFIIIIPILFIVIMKHPKLKQYFIKFIKYLRNNHSIKGYISYIIFIILMSSLISNSTIPNLLSGMIYGTFKGSIISSIGIIISGCISFLLSKFFFKKRIENTLKNNIIFKKYYNIIENSEKNLDNIDYLQLIFLSRLAPISPYHTFSYFWGITDVKFFIFLVGTLGVIPSTIFETYIGSQFSNIDEIFEKKSKLKHIIIIIIISIIIGIIIVLIINNILKKKSQIEKKKHL